MEELCTIRQAVMGDLDQTAELFNGYRMFYKQASNIEAAKEFLSLRLELKESVILIAVNDGSGAAVAFTQLYPSFSSISMQRTWILNDLYVSEDCRGQGIAQLLLDAAKDYAKETGAKGLSLSTAIDNDTAQKLYERNGFMKDEEFYHYSLMVKDQ